MPDCPEEQPLRVERSLLRGENGKPLINEIDKGQRGPGQDPSANHGFQLR
jgi:hypothetical protein